MLLLRLQSIYLWLRLIDYHIMTLISRTNKYIDETAPWVLAGMKNVTSNDEPLGG